MLSQGPQILISSLSLTATMHDDLKVDRLQLVSPYADLSSALVLELHLGRYGTKY